MLLQLPLSGESYFYEHWVVFVVVAFLFFSPWLKCLYSLLQSATGDSLGAPEALSDNVKGETTNIEGAAAREKKKKKKTYLEEPTSYSSFSGN